MKKLNLNLTPGKISAAAIVGVITTGVLSFRAGAKSAVDTVPKDETKKQKFVRVAKHYIPPVISGAVTIGCIVGSNKMHSRKEVELASALAVSGAALKEKDRFEQKVKEAIGEEKAKELKEEARRDYIGSLEVPPKPPEGNTSRWILVYEPVTDQLIWTTTELFAWALLETNKRLQREYDCRVNYFVKLIGGKSDSPSGNKLGWNWENEIQGEMFEYYGGVWVHADLVPSNDNEDILRIIYAVEPEPQEPEDMVYGKF